MSNWDPKAESSLPDKDMEDFLGRYAGVSAAKRATIPPEQRLWMRVILYEVADALTPDKRAKKSKAARNRRDEARSLIFTTASTSAKYFDLICTLAGFNAFYIRRKVKEKIDEKDEILGLRILQILDDLPINEGQHRAKKW